MYNSNDTDNLKKIIKKYKPAYDKYLNNTISEEKIQDYVSSICDLIYADTAGIYVYSMLNEMRLDNIKYCCEYAINNNIPGDFLEAGVWRGGTGILMKDYVNKLKSSKKVYLLDSFEGMENLESEETSHLSHPVDILCSKVLNDMEKYFGRTIIKTSIEEVTNNFKHFDLYDSNVIMMKGWFNDEFPFNKINSLSVIRLDCDYYYPTKICLEHLYPKLSKGGFVILDEYYLEFMGEKYAVDEFRQKYNITEKIIRVDSNVAFWQK